MREPLIHEGDDDYTLNPDETCAWITVGNLSVFIYRTQDGVEVSIYPLGDEADDAALLGKTSAPFCDGGVI